MLDAKGDGDAIILYWQSFAAISDRRVLQFGDDLTCAFSRGFIGANAVPPVGPKLTGPITDSRKSSSLPHFAAIMCKSSTRSNGFELLKRH